MLCVIYVNLVFVFDLILRLLISLLWFDELLCWFDICAIICLLGLVSLCFACAVRLKLEGWFYCAVCCFYVALLG